MTFTLGSMNAALVNAEYAVRGAIVTRAAQISEELKKHPEKYNFKQVISCNIGNPQALLQQPIRYYRDVSALLASPWMLDDDVIRGRFKSDVVARAESMLAKIGHYNKTGAYTESKGYAWVRENVARSLEKRDGVPADPNNIFLTDGASPGIKLMLNCLITTDTDAVMIPIPQYPLYTASLTTFNGVGVPYYLDEANGWGLSIEELRKAYDDACKEKNIRALVVINPGNPTGQVLSREQISEIVDFAKEKGLMILADEVYQENIYSLEKQFTSFKAVVGDRCPLVSFHSISKGVIGECGKRGGYMEAHNLNADVMGLLEKLCSISLCPNVTGQILVDLMMTPPAEGEASFTEFKAEYDSLLGSLNTRASKLAKSINDIKGMRTNVIEGAMYAFPSLTLPPSFIKEAEDLNIAPDAHWAMKLVEETGIVVVPGSGFGQKPGTHHFRITILPPEDLMDDIIAGLQRFQDKIMREYQ